MKTKRQTQNNYLEETIKKYLIESPYPQFTKGKAWKVFRKSQFFQWAASDIEELGESERMRQYVAKYANDFYEATKYLNII